MPKNSSKSSTIEGKEESQNNQLNKCHSRCVCKCEKALTGSHTIAVKAKAIKSKSDKNNHKKKAGAVQQNKKLPRFEVSAKAAARSVVIDWKYFKRGSCALKEGLVFAKGWRKLLRFTTQVVNTGTADFVLGDPSQSDLFSFSNCHNHYHLKNYAKHQLLDAEGREVVQSQKVGFCLMDSIAVTSGKAPKYNCDKQGMSRGWSDVYNAKLDGQHCDITEVEPGDYTLRITVDPEGLFETLPSPNNVAEIAVTIPSD